MKSSGIRTGPLAKILLLGVVALMFLAVLPGQAANDPADGFTIEIQVTSDLDASYFPEMVVDQDDNIHLFWLNATSRDIDNLQAKNGQISYTKISPYGEVLVPEKRIIPIYPDNGDEFWTTPVSVGMVPDGDIHLTWADSHTGLFQVNYMKVDQEGNMVLHIDNVTDTFTAKYPKLDVDRKGDVHLAWAQWEIFGSENGYPNIYYTKLDPQGEVLISRVAVSQTFLASNHPDIAVDHGQNAHIVFEENVNLPGYTDEIYYCVVDPEGDLKVNLERVTVLKGSSLKPDITIDQIDVPHLVWANINVETNIYYTKLRDLDNIETKKITDSVTESNNPRLVLDDMGVNICIVWSEERYVGIRENSRIMYSKLNDTWSVTKPETYLTYGGLGAEMPVVAMDGYKNYIVAWDDIRVDPGTEEKVWDIYYTRETDGTNLEPVDILEVNGIPIDNDMELKFFIGDEVTLFAGNSSDPNPWDESVEYNFTIIHDEFKEASGWRSNDTFTYKFNETGIYSIYVKVRDSFGLENGRPKAVLIKVVKKEGADTNVILKNPSVKGAVVAGSIGITATLGYIVAGTEIGKYKFLTMLAVPLYSRIKKEKTLDNYIRGQIHGYILAKPGCHYNQIKQTLGLNNGTLAYHLRKLEREEFIKAERDGMYKRFYPMGLKIPKKTLKLSAMQKRILEVITMNPGISQKEVAKEVGISAPAVIYHIGVLAGAKLVKREKKGSRVEYRAIEQTDEDEEISITVPASTS